MITLNQTPTTDNAVIMFFKVYLDDEIVYLTDKTNGITLTNVYSGAEYGRDTNNNEIQESCDLVNGGSLPSVASITLVLPRDNREYLPYRIIDVGIGWEGITADSQITWLYQFYIQNPTYDLYTTTIELYTYDIFNVELPKHIIQKENANANYYFPQADKDNLNLPLPLLYGDFSSYTELEFNYARLAYTICTNAYNFTYLFASHKCYETMLDITFTDLGGTTWDNALFMYLSGANNYLEVLPKSSFSVNDHSNSLIQIFSDTRAKTEYVHGCIALSKFKIFQESDIIYDVEYINENRLSDYSLNKSVSLLPTQALAVKLDTNLSESELGLLSSLNNSDIKVKVYWQSKTAGTTTLSVYYFNPNLGSPYSTPQTFTTALTGLGNWEIDSFLMAQETSAKGNTDLPFTIEEIQNYGYIFINDTAAIDINIWSLKIILDKILISKLPTKPSSTLYGWGRGYVGT